MTTYDKLRLRRVRLRLKAQDVAARVGVTASTFSRWEAGRLTPNAEHLKAWKRALR